MKTRGEKQYVNMPIFAARLYDNLTSIKGVQNSFEEISFFIDGIVKRGKLLDIGTGPGRLLYEIYKRNQEIELYGLDISASMLEVAKKNLSEVKHIELSVGNISSTGYNDNFFDCILSTGSFYNWDNPVESINEIFRILKPGKTAFIFDSYKDYDPELLSAGLKYNLKSYNPVRRFISIRFLKKQLAMTYTLDEYHELVKKTMFRNNYQVRPIVLGNLPVYVRIELSKQ
jgi:ubiquinone/menaquinone biosynthesis C-methylase UbiE